MGAIGKYVIYCNVMYSVEDTGDKGSVGRFFFELAERHSLFPLAFNGSFANKEG